MRIRLDLSYDGTDFTGWAVQPAFRTVQGTLEEALSTTLRLPLVRVVCAGRTDTGVHARGQVVHLDVEPDLLAAVGGRAGEQPLEALARRLNGVLPPDVRIHRAAAAEPGFDARFSATSRRYAYRIADRPETVDPLVRNHVLAWGRELDLAAMQAASTPLLGLRDFAAFCRRRDGATTVRTLLELSWSRTPAGIVEARIVADAFCHSMVRSLVGCLLSVGDGRRPTGWGVELLAARARHPAVTVAPAHGLTLEEVRYPEGAELLAQAERARNPRSPVA